MSLFQDSLVLPKVCLYALVNEEDKRVFVGYTKNLPFAVAKHLSDLQDGVHKCRNMIADQTKLQLVILETTAGSREQKLRVLYWYDYYKKLEYALYSEYKFLHYKVKICVSMNFKAIVMLYNKRNRIVVGGFDTIAEAEAFIADKYADTPIFNIVYAKNELTREYKKRRNKAAKLYGINTL